MPATLPPRLILFTRWPRPGAAKTRLIPALGPDGAADLHREMTRRALTVLMQAAHETGAEVEVRGDGAEPEAVAAWLGPGPRYAVQGPGGLGQRMHRAIAQALADGAAGALVVGSDLPDLSAEIVSRAVAGLAPGRVVLGPATDGGYYLVGLARPQAGLFADMTWGGPEVLAATLARADELGLEPLLLPGLADVDRPRDLHLWHLRTRLPRQEEPGLISVVMPCRNEALRLAGAVASLGASRDTEVIVADGMSTDGTARLARGLGLRVIPCPPGRGGQLRAGARAARGEILLFLHADTRLPQGWREEVRRLLGQPGVSLGAFTFRLDRESPGGRLIELMVGLRSRWGQLPYGDQALFMRSADLALLGGHPPQPLMEDVDLVARARGLGRVAISPLAAVSSARRWQEQGYAANTLRNWTTYLAHRMGTRPEALARRYYRPRP